MAIAVVCICGLLVKKGTSKPLPSTSKAHLNNALLHKAHLLDLKQIVNCLVYNSQKAKHN